MPNHSPTTTFTRQGNLFLPDYYVTNAGVYAKHVANIRDDTHHPTITIDGKAIHRPATFKEGIEVRVHIGENIIANNPGLTKEELKAKLNETKIFSTYQDSITAIAYQAKSTHFKIIPICTQLITIPHNNTEPFLALSYTTIPGKELTATTAHTTDHSPNKNSSHTKDGTNSSNTTPTSNKNMRTSPT